MGALRTAAMWLRLLACGLVALPVIFLGVVFLPRRRAWRLAQRLVGGSLRLLGIRLEVEGLGRLDPRRTYVLVGNHVNLLDHFALLAISPVPFVGLEKARNKKVPLYGKLVERWGNVFTGEGVGGLRALVRAGQRLAEEHLWLLVFPEGTRTRDGRVQAFKRGAFYIARSGEVAVAPFTLNGAQAVLRTGSWRFRPGTIRITFAQPLEPDPDPERLAQRARAAVLASYEGPKSAEDLELEQLELPPRPGISEGPSP